MPNVLTRVKGYWQGKRTRNIHEDSIFYHHEISQLSSRESRKSRRRRVASPALVGVRRVFSAGWHTQALARVICEIREIRVKFNHLCVKILVRLPWAIGLYLPKERSDISL